MNPNKYSDFYNFFDVLDPVKKPIGKPKIPTVAIFIMVTIPMTFSEVLFPCIVLLDLVLKK